MEQKNKKIKACQVSTIPLAIYFLLLNQLKNLRNVGYEVSVVCSPGDWDKEIEQEGFPLKKIKMTRRISFFSDIVSFVKLYFYFKKEKFDIVHTSTPKAGLLGTMAARMAGIPIVIHSNLGFYFNENTPQPWKTLYICMEKIVATCADLVLSVDQEDIDNAIEKKICDRSKIKLLGGWVDMERFNPQKFSKEFIEKKKKELGIPADKKVIGIVARLVREKGYLDLFEALSLVLKKNPNLALVVVGDEDHEKKDSVSPEVISDYGLKKGRDVIFLGQIINVEEIYAIMDIFVLPSWREGIGISILESSAMEKPVISTQTRGCREAVDDGKTGILVPVKNPGELAGAIKFFLENPGKAAEFGKNGRRKIEKEFNEKIVFERINTEYERLIKEKINR